MHLYPVAEIFSSVQGEGRWTGTPMAFVRLAGCTVGKPYTPAAREQLGLQVYQERCTDWSGSSFPCDTNYRMSKRMTSDEIARTDEVKNALRVSITGGEPLMHDLTELVSALAYLGKKIHIETSATLRIPDCLQVSESSVYEWQRSLKLWLVASPKKDYRIDVLNEADEIKVLVGSDFDEQQFESRFYGPYGEKLSLLPINDENTLNMDNVNRCMQLLQRYPKCSISLQIHKLLGVR